MILSNVCLSDQYITEKQIQEKEVRWNDDGDLTFWSSLSIQSKLRCGLTCTVAICQSPCICLLQ